MYATLDHIDQTAAHILTFWFRPEKPFEYVAGQFTELYLPHENADDRGQKRWFTISSSPTDELFSITTKFATGRSSSFKEALRNLQPGSRHHFAEPMGDFVLPKNKGIPLVFAVGGLGITPVHSMIKYLHDQNEQRPISLLYAVHDQNEIAFRDLFETYPLEEFTPILSQPLPDWDGAIGHLDTMRILEAASDPASTIYLSGPEYLVEQLNADLLKSGIPGYRLVTDFFHGYRDV